MSVHYLLPISKVISYAAAVLWIFMVVDPANHMFSCSYCSACDVCSNEEAMQCDRILEIFLLVAVKAIINFV